MITKTTKTRNPPSIQEHEALAEQLMLLEEAVDRLAHRMGRGVGVTRQIDRAIEILQRKLPPIRVALSDRMANDHRSITHPRPLTLYAQPSPVKHDTLPNRPLTIDDHKILAVYLKDADAALSTLTKLLYIHSLKTSVGLPLLRISDILMQIRSDLEKRLFKDHPKDPATTIDLYYGAAR